MIDTNIIDKARETLDIRPLVAIDCALEGFSWLKQGESSVQTTPLLHIFCQAILQSIELNTAALSENPASVIFDLNLSQQQQRFVAICLLRLLSTYDGVLKTDSSFRIETFKLFDRMLSDDLYKNLNLELSAQTFEKESRLKDPFPQLESEFTETLASIKAIEMLSAFRQAYMQKINSRTAKALLWQFSPRISWTYN